MCSLNSNNGRKLLITSAMPSELFCILQFFGEVNSWAGLFHCTEFSFSEEIVTNIKTC